MLKCIYKKIVFFLFLTIIIFYGRMCFAGSAPQPITIDLHNISVQDALHLLTKFMRMNVVLSPHINGMTSLHLYQIPAEQALDSLLASQKLNKWQVDHVWYIMPHQEWLQYQEDHLRMQTLRRESAPLVTRVWQIHYANATDLQHIIQENGHSLLSKRGDVRVDARTNILCVHDIDESITDINHLIRRLDIPVQQVLIEAKLASIDSDFEHTLGIQFTNETTHHDDAAHNTAPLDSVPHFSVAVVTLPDHSKLDMQLTALENNGHGELISKPSLFTANQQTATIEAGEEIPYQETSANGATSVTFKKAVLRLSVTPQVMPDERVLLNLQVNQDKPTNRMILGVPAISTRQISTHILIKNGQTVVLGGIYETNDQHNLQQIPFLGKIPIIGWLFKQQDVSKTKRELLIFVTPNIIR